VCGGRPGEDLALAVARICAELHERFEAFKRRDLFEVKLVVLFLDAIYPPVRPSGRKEGVICAWRITENGDRALVSVRLGMREGKEDWLELGRELIARGLAASRLVVADGAPGLISAVEEIWPHADRQHLHRLRDLQPSCPSQSTTGSVSTTDQRSPTRRSLSLVLSEKTVERHLSRIFAKLGAHSRVEVAHIAEASPRVTASNGNVAAFSPRHHFNNGLHRSGSQTDLAQISACSPPTTTSRPREAKLAADEKQTAEIERQGEPRRLARRCYIRPAMRKRHVSVLELSTSGTIASASTCPWIPAKRESCAPVPASP